MHFRASRAAKMSLAALIALAMSSTKLHYKELPTLDPVSEARPRSFYELTSDGTCQSRSVKCGEKVTQSKSIMQYKSKWNLCTPSKQEDWFNLVVNAPR